MDESWKMPIETLLKIEVKKGGLVEALFRMEDPNMRDPGKRSEMACRAFIGAMCFADPKFEELLRAGCTELKTQAEFKRSVFDTNPTLNLEREILSRNLVNQVLGKLLQHSLFVMLGDPEVFTQREQQVRGPEGQDQGIRNN